MPIDYLLADEQEAYDKVIALINKFIYCEQFKEKVIKALDELVEILTNIDLI